MIWPVTFLFAVFIRSVSSQSNAFVCVPAANCVTSTAVQPGSGVIDVRIVTPVSFELNRIYYNNISSEIGS